jgi:hypothetical protein
MALRRVLCLTMTFGLGTLDEKEIGRQSLCPEVKPSPNYAYNRIFQQVHTACLLSLLMMNFPCHTAENMDKLLWLSLRSSKWRIASRTEDQDLSPIHVVCRR